MPDYQEWLKEGISKDDVGALAVAEALKVHLSTVYKLMDGTRKFRPQELPIIAKAIKEPLPVTNAATILPVTGYVSVEDWSKIARLNSDASISILQHTAAKISALAHDSKAGYVAYRVKGSCMGDAAVREGDDIACINNVARLSTGQIVVAERVVGRSKVHALRRVVMHGQRVGLESICASKSDGSLEMAGDGTRVCALAVAVSRSLI